MKELKKRELKALFCIILVIALSFAACKNNAKTSEKTESALTNSSTQVNESVLESTKKGASENSKSNSGELDLNAVTDTTVQGVKYIEKDDLFIKIKGEKINLNDDLTMQYFIDNGWTNREDMFTGDQAKPKFESIIKPYSESNKITSTTLSKIINDKKYSIGVSYYNPTDEDIKMNNASVCGLSCAEDYAVSFIGSAGSMSRESLIEKLNNSGYTYNYYRREVNNNYKTTIYLYSEDEKSKISISYGDDLDYDETELTKFSVDIVV